MELLLWILTKSVSSGYIILDLNNYKIANAFQNFKHNKTL